MRIQYRDSLRALLYHDGLQQAAEIAEQLCADFNQQLSSAQHSQFLSDSQPQLTSNTEAVVSSLLNDWALTLDDIVVSFLSSAIAEAEAAGDLGAFNEQSPSQNSRYKAFFLDSTGQLHPRIQELPTTCPFLFETCSRYLSGQISSLKLALSRLQSDWVDILRSDIFTSTAASAAAPPPAAHETIVPSVRLPVNYLVRIEGSGSDRHCNGQQVLFFSFASLGKIVYKPSGGHAAKLWSEYVAHLSQLIPSTFSLASMKILFPSSSSIQQGLESQIAGSGYYWAEYIETKELDSDADVGVYFRNCGLFLAVAQAAGLGDAHEENLICNGVCPILVDCETLFQPVPSKDVDARSRVLATLLLQQPPKPFEAFGAGWFAAFQHPPVQSVRSPHVDVDNERTAKIRVSFGASAQLHRSQCLPFSKSGQAHPLHLHTNYFVEGYEAGAAVVRACFSDMTEAFIAWEKAVLQAPVRIIVRPTAFYSALLQSLRQYDTLRFESIAKQHLVSALSFERNSSDSELVLAAEVFDLLRGDIPMFLITSASGALIHPSTDTIVLPNFLNAQVSSTWSIQRCLEADFFCPQADLLEIIAVVPDLDLSVPDSTIFDYSFAVSKKLLTSLLDEPTPSLPPALLRQVDTVDPASLSGGLPASSLSLYSGLAGELIFLAALACVAHDTSLRSVTLRISNQFAAAVLKTSKAAKLDFETGRPGSTATLSTQFISVMNGICGTAFAFASVACFLNDGQLFSLAVGLVCSIPLGAIEVDSIFDLMDGCAGLIVCISEFLSVSVDARQSWLKDEERITLLKLLAFAGQHLLSKQQRSDLTGGVFWPRRSGLFSVEQGGLTGVSHGNAGIGLALFHLHKLLSAETFVDALSDCWKHENFFFDEKQLNWKDIRPWSNGYTMSWCYGSPGICQARLVVTSSGIADSICSAAQRIRDITQSVLAKSPLFYESTEASFTGPRGSLQDENACCGRASIVDFLVSLSNFASDSTLHMQARSIALDLLRHVAKNNLLYIENDVGLFTGHAGMAYACLRMANPCLPALSLLQLPRLENNAFNAQHENL